jgi:hypothetical protein
MQPSQGFPRRSPVTPPYVRHAPNQLARHSEELAGGSANAAIILSLMATSLK